MTRIDYTHHLPEDVHSFRFLQADRQACDDYMALQIKLMADFRQAGDMPAIIRILLDLTPAGLYPFRYMIERTREFFKDYDDLPQAYVAYLLKDQRDVAIINGLAFNTATHQQDTRRVFRADEKAAALQ
jgi:hypothetical protein